MSDLEEWCRELQASEAKRDEARARLAERFANADRDREALIDRIAADHVWQDAPDDVDYATGPGTPLHTFTDDQLRQHDAEVAAKALDAAADALDSDPVIRPSQFAWLYYPDQMKQKKRDLNFAATRLRDRADRIRREAATPAGPLAHMGGRANAEDCPACAGTNPPYPFICPGGEAS